MTANTNGNRIQLYSNGLACVTRGQEVVKAGTPVEIPCKHAHLGDVLASLIVGGSVTEMEPATFRPDDTAEGLLEIDPANAFVSTFRKVSGVAANVVLTGGKTIQNATILGVEDDKVAIGNGTSTVHQLVFSDAGKIRRVGLPGVESVEVMDAIAKAEIDRALRRNLRKIKPGSTFVSMKLAADEAEKANALVTYVVPVPATSYTYRLTSGLKGKAGLVGFGIVHNDTEDDWNGVTMDVIIGSPLTCLNDLAQRVHPIRTQQSFVQRRTQAGFEVEGSLGDMTAAFALNDSDESALEVASYGAESMSRGMKGGGAAARLCSMGPAAAPPRAAKRATAKSESVDDFAVFTSPNPVTIAGNSSGLVPIIELELATRTVLIFDPRQSQTQCFRAMEFHNTGDKTLPFGALTIYTNAGEGGKQLEYNTLLGETLKLRQLKAGEKGRVPYAPDTNVRPKVEDTGVTQVLTGFEVAEGVVAYTFATESKTTYSFFNQGGKEEVEVLIEHVSRIQGSTPEAKAAACERTDSGYRFTVKVPAEKGTVKFEVVERGTAHQQVHFNGPWANQYLVAGGEYADLLKVPEVKAAVDLWSSLAEKDREISEANDAVRNAQADQGRATQALAHMKDGDDRGNWNKYLNEAEEIIRKTQRETLPRLTKERQKMGRDAEAAFGKARAKWLPKPKQQAEAAPAKK